MPKVAALLELLRRETERDSRLWPSRPLRKLPTLAPDRPRTASRQLAERFRFAGRWENVVLGTTWLAIHEMKPDRDLRDQIELRATYWLRSAPARFPAAQVSLFAVDQDDQNETYLVWDRPEPRVFEYFGASEVIHRDLRAYLQSHLATALALGPNTPPANGTTDLAAYLANETTRLDRWVEGLRRWGQRSLTRAALTSARLVLPILEKAHPDDRRPRQVLALTEAWMRCPCEDHAATMHRAALELRPISPSLSGGKRLFDAGHAICYATYSAVWMKLAKSIPPATRARLELLVDHKPAELARLLNAEQLASPSGAPFTPATAKSTLVRVVENLDDSATWAGNTAAAAAKLLGKPAVVRAAIREALLGER